MPYAPGRPCRGSRTSRRCPQLTTSGDGYCPECRTLARKEFDSRPHRKEAHGFYKSAAWLALRAQVLAEEPVCRICESALSTVADHIKDRRSHPELELVRENLRGACKPCHDRRSGRQAQEKRRA